VATQNWYYTKSELPPIINKTQPIIVSISTFYSTTSGTTSACFLVLVHCLLSLTFLQRWFFCFSNCASSNFSKTCCWILPVSSFDSTIYFRPYWKSPVSRRFLTGLWYKSISLSSRRSYNYCCLRIHSKLSSFERNTFCLLEINLNTEGSIFPWSSNLSLYWVLLISNVTSWLIYKYCNFIFYFSLQKKHT